MIKDILENQDSAALSEEMKTSISEAFEKAVEAKLDETFEVKVSERALELVESKDAEYKKYLEESEAKMVEEATEFKTSLINTIDAYVEQFVSEMVSKSLSDMKDDITVAKSEAIVEAFEKLGLEVKTQEVDSKIDERNSSVEEIKAELNTIVNENIKLKGLILAMEKDAIVAEASVSLTDIQKEKLMKIAEAFGDIKDLEDFSKKVAIVVESFEKSTEPSEPAAKEEKIVESKVETKTFNSRFL